MQDKIWRTIGIVIAIIVFVVGIRVGQRFSSEPPEPETEITERQPLEEAPTGQ